MFLHVMFERLEVTGRKKGMTSEEKTFPPGSPRNPPEQAWRPAGSRSDLGWESGAQCDEGGLSGESLQINPTVAVTRTLQTVHTLRHVFFLSG